jgi:molybdopterin-guanine dinucleotide biosynthesis protein A
MDAIILAGGRGTRMGGVDKASLKLGDTTFIEHLVNTLSLLAATVFVSVSSLEGFCAPEGVRVVTDDPPGRGPLGGLRAGLEASEAEWCFVACVDAPLLQPSLVRLLAGWTADADAVVPVWDHGPEPLCALYARRCLPAIEKTMHQGRVISFHPLVRTRHVPQAAVRRADPAGWSFVNTNTRADYERLPAL